MLLNSDFKGCSEMLLVVEHGACFPLRWHRELVHGFFLHTVVVTKVLSWAVVLCCKGADLGAL